MSSGRIERCYTDNIYLIESLLPDETFPYIRKYLIMGHSGNTYQVTITNHPKCTCPDYSMRHNRCKHIYFVLIRIMNINNYTDREFSDEELLEMFDNIHEIAKNLMYQGEKPEEQKEVNQKFEKGDDCPICLDPLENGKELDYCKYSCGKTVHKKCFKMWEKSKGGICVFCRGKWYSNCPSSNPKKVSMHPIEVMKNDQEGDKDNKNNEKNNNNYEKIEIEEEDDSNKINYKKSNYKKNNKKEKIRNNNNIRNRRKTKSKEKNMSKSESKSRSRSKSLSKNKNRKKIKYPKK